MDNLTTSLDRVQHTLDEIVRFNATPDCGYTRFSYSPEDKAVRQYLIQKMESAGMSVATDAVGNIRGRLDGRHPDRPSIMAGSHIDTVFHGGKYDGALGVVAALEVVNVLNENQIILDYPYGVIIFAEEEGSNFGVTTLGSKCLVGECSLDYLKQLKNPQGISSYDMMREFGLEPDNLQADILKPGEVHAMLELHIEQSVVLENKNIELGIVEEVAGRKACSVVLNGASGHAGATPMDLRKDAMVGACEIITAIDAIISASGGPRTVVTVGSIRCEPNVSNSIAGTVEFSLDIRDVEEKWMSAVVEGIKARIVEVCNTRELEFKFDLKGSSSGMYLSKKLTGLTEKTARAHGHSSLRMMSGAVHDSALLTQLTDVGMIFIPSIGGVSHVPEEYSTPESIQVGCNMLLHTVLNISND